MKTDDLENELRNLRLAHLTESELEAYCDQELDQIGRARAESHLKQCFICKRQLELLREESAALSNRARSAEDVAFVERLTGDTKVKPQSLRERLVEYLRQMGANWRVSFEPVRRHSDEGEEVWQWQSEDGHMQARATMEKNADMIVRFSSNKMELEGAQFNFRLGSLKQELTLRRISESEIAAQVAIPWPYRQENMMTDISIEIV